MVPMRRSTRAGLAAAVLLAGLLPGLPGAAGAGVPCASDAECDAEERCHGTEACGEGVCVPAFTLSHFPLESVGVDAYSTEITAVLDHSGQFFYTQCCDTEIVAYTGEVAPRGPDALCPSVSEFPACFSQICICGYSRDDGELFEINGNYVGFGGRFLLYDGHAGYDYTYPAGTPIVAPRGGLLCKAQEDPINGRFGFDSAWEKFHTFYIDHGDFAGTGWSTWFLHATDLDGVDTEGRALADLAPGECAEVVEGQTVATVGNVGTFLPHLHFEVRRYRVGPESASTRGFDPYGWQGDGADPLAGNGQAAAQDAPIWIACGNGRIECGETCDDGNRRDEDGCSADCQLDPLLACFDDLARLEAEIAECRAEVEDADADGEADASDRCLATPTGAAVDDGGCSREQFCNAIPVDHFMDRWLCSLADWRNDDPPLRVPRDCRVDLRRNLCRAR